MLASFYLLAEVSDKYFVVSLDKIAERLKMSHEVAGATLMAVGSSAPELFVAIISLMKDGDHHAIGVGTIVGSALFNILVIVGASAFVRKATLVWQPISRDLLFYGIAVLGLLLVLINGSVSFWESLTFVILYIVYIIAVMNWQKIFKYKDLSENDTTSSQNSHKSGWKKVLVPLDFMLGKLFPSPKFYIFQFFISIAAIAILSWILVESAIHISHLLDVPEVVIALTVLAIGTSIPDLMSSIIVAKQGRGGMAVTNAIGSNIFDIFIGLGLPWLIIIIAMDGHVLTDTSGLFVSVGLLAGSIVVMFLVLYFKKWKIGRGLGIFFISLYLVYIMYSIYFAIS